MGGRGRSNLKWLWIRFLSSVIFSFTGSKMSAFDVTSWVESSRLFTPDVFKLRLNTSTNRWQGVPVDLLTSRGVSPSEDTLHTVVLCVTQKSFVQLTNVSPWLDTYKGSPHSSTFSPALTLRSLWGRSAFSLISKEGLFYMTNSSWGYRELVKLF